MAAVKNAVSLPNEVWLQIFENILGPCCLRRHIVAHLRQMHLMQLRNDDAARGGQYTSQVHDDIVRGSAGMDHRERLYYRQRQGELETIQDADRTTIGELDRLLVERNWLRKPPMDYESFRHFCRNPNDRRYADRKDLVLELFPLADFFRPSQHLTQLGPGARGTLAERARLAHVPGPVAAGLLHVLDREVYTGRCALWTAIIPSMPRSVKRVRAIAKDAPAPGMTVLIAQLKADELGHIGQEMQRLENAGKLTNGGLLYYFATLN